MGSATGSQATARALEPSPVMAISRSSGRIEPAINRIIGCPHDRLLAQQQLRDLALLGLDFRLELTVFEMAEIDLRILSLDDTTEPADDPADALPEDSPT